MAGLPPPPGVAAVPKPERRVVRSEGLGIALRLWRRPERPTLLFVHGYPDDSSVWDAVVAQLVGEFQIAVYDVRGAGESEAPPHVADYGYDHLVADLAAVIDSVSPRSPVHLVAHDWGSLQCWEAVTTGRFKGRIASMTSISGPCLDHVGFWIREAMRGSWRQRWQALGQVRRSWYMFFFQVPRLAPLGWRLLLARLWPSMLRRSDGIVVPPNPRQLRNGVNGIRLYRANFLPRMRAPRERYAHAPVQLLVALRDPFISPAIYTAIPRWVADFQREDVDSGHWLPLSHPAWLAERIRRFVLSRPARG
jgi:pimeloyl-ACP methyl ester carboxylesterase